jgi:predicted transcriptional regulator
VKEIKMEELRLGIVEAKFADIVWANAPISTKELVAVCERELNWKRTTTYTVLKKLCERGLFVTEQSEVSVLISRDEFYAMQSEKFVDDTFGGSLPAFIAAFASRKRPTEEELEEIRRMIEKFGED